MEKQPYQLRHDEVLLKKHEKVAHHNEIGQLLLTNHNLVHIASKGIFRTNYVVNKYAIRTIKAYNDQAQIFIEKGGKIEVFFHRGQEKFEFRNDDAIFSEKKAEREALEWIKTINQLLAGEDVELSAQGRMVIPEIAMIADAVGDTFGSVMNSLGLGRKEAVAAARVSRKCLDCGATVAGREGKSARCSYCGSEQKL